jgi:hypothetical protein
MAVKKIQEDWQIQPTTAEENAETQANMAAALAEQQKETETQEQAEGDAPASIYDNLMQLWGGTLNRKQSAIKSAAEQMTALDKERKEAEEKLAKARENKSNFLATLLEEQKPVRKEDEEKKLRNRAIIKGLGDLVGAIAAGAHAYGKRGMGYVPTLATSSPLKDIEKLNALQEEYLKRKEAWKALDMKIRMGDVDAEGAEAQAAYANAVERMKDAQKRYDDAVKDYNTATDDYHKDVADVVAEEHKQDRMDAREKYRQEGGNKTQEERELEVYNALFPWEPHDVISESYDEYGDMTGYSKRDSKYSEDLPEIKAKAHNNEYVKAVFALEKMGYAEEDAVELVRAQYEEDMLERAQYEEEQYEEDMKAAALSFHKDIKNKINGKSK